MILQCLEGMYVAYTSEIFSDPRRKKVFVEQYLGLFLAELGLFCHFVPGLLAIALGSRLPLFIWIAGIGLGTRLSIALSVLLGPIALMALLMSLLQFSCKKSISMFFPAPPFQFAVQAHMQW